MSSNTTVYPPAKCLRMFKTQIRQRCHRKRKLQANIPDEHRDKNSQQNIIKTEVDSTLKEHDQMGFTWEARLVQHLQISQCDTLH